MNFDPSFHTTKEFRAFKRSAGPDALEYLFMILTSCQVQKTSVQKFKNDQDLADLLGVSCDQGKTIFQALKDTGFIESFNPNEETDLYRISIYERMNENLITKWKNGASGGRPPLKANLKKNNSTALKSDQLTQPTIEPASSQASECDGDEDVPF